MSTHRLPPNTPPPRQATLLKGTSRAQVVKQVEDGMGVQREEMEDSWGSKLKREAMREWRGLSAFLAGTMIKATVLYPRAKKDWIGSIQRHW